MIKTALSRKRTRAVYFFLYLSLSEFTLEKENDLMRERVVVPSFFSRCAFGDDD